MYRYAIQGEGGIANFPRHGGISVRGPDQRVTVGLASGRPSGRGQLLSKTEETGSEEPVSSVYFIERDENYFLNPFSLSSVSEI